MERWVKAIKKGGKRFQYFYGINFYKMISSLVTYLEIGEIISALYYTCFHLFTDGHSTQV